MASDNQKSVSPPPAPPHLLNNYSIGLHTRRLLNQLVTQKELDHPSLLLIERALEQSRPKNISGWVYLLADALGSPIENAMEMGSFIELFFAALDLIDDIQDGDADKYLNDVPLPVQINLGIHLLTLAIYAAERFYSQLPEKKPDSLVSHLTRLLSGVICAQRIELTRENWSSTTYQWMSQVSAGKQLELYFRAATLAANVDVTPFLALTEPLGFLLELTCDERSHDNRVFCLPSDELNKMREDAKEQLALAFAQIPIAARPVIERLFAFALARIIHEDSL